MRDDDNSDASDEAPRAKDKCYIKELLRDKFRMKPAPGAEPVRSQNTDHGDVRVMTQCRNDFQLNRALRQVAQTLFTYRKLKPILRRNEVVLI